MADPYIENYKKSVEKIMARKGKELEKLKKELEPVEKALKQAQDQKHKKAEKEQEKKRAAIRKKIDAAANDLAFNLKLIEIPPEADEKELVKVPQWLKTVIQKKGLPLGNSVSIAPDIAFDFKNKKIKKLGIVIRW